MTTVLVERRNDVAVVTVARPRVRNAVDVATARRLRDAFAEIDGDAGVRAAVLQGAGGHFSSGLDLKALPAEAGELGADAAAGHGPMGPTRMRLTTPVIAAIEGYAVAGGLELSLWCDLRVAAADATLGVLNRRWGVPLVDGGTVRLPRIVGQGRALDLILTGRPVSAAEAHAMGLVDRVVPPEEALPRAVELAADIARFPPASLAGDRLSALGQWGLPESDALALEQQHGSRALSSGEAVRGAERFAAGHGRHGDFADI